MDGRYWLLIIAGLAGVALLVLVLVTDRQRRRKELLVTELSEIRSAEPDMAAYKARLTELGDQLSEQVVAGVMDPGLAAQCDDVYGHILTGSPLLDSLLTQKQAACRELSIDFVCRITEVPARIDDRDLVGLFANLLDNAIEAAVRYAVATGKTGFVGIVNSQMGRQWNLTVENSKRTEETPLAEGMRSTKTAPGEHGLGGRIIDRVARKNGGFVRRTDDGEAFRVLVSMPVEELT